MGTSVLGERTATVFSVEDIEDSTNLHYCGKHKSCVCVCVCVCVQIWIHHAAVLYFINRMITVLHHSRAHVTCYISVQAGSGFMSHI